MNAAELRALENVDFSKAIKRKYKWDFVEALDTDLTEEDKELHVNNFTADPGYFGYYRLIKFKGKYTLCKYSNRVGDGAKAAEHWYDKIFYGGESHEYWSADYRWNSDKPIAAMLDGKYTLIAPHSCKPMLKEALDKLSIRWVHTKEGYRLTGMINGKEVKVTDRGAVIDTSIDLNAELERCKAFTAEQRTEWIKAGGICTKSHGLWNGGAGAGTPLPVEEALRCDSRYSFSNGFYYKSWVISQKHGCVVLEFNERSEADMW